MSKDEINQDRTILTDFVDDFNGTSLNPVWGCEFQCPTVSGGYARFSLQPGFPPNQNQTWSKLVYKNQTFSYGIYSMTFRYNRRPTETEVWAGMALYGEDPSGNPNEVNFGIDSACIQRCNNQQFFFETYKQGKSSSLIVDTGVNLYDGNWHTGEIIFTATKVTLNFDSRHIADITDTTTIPTASMEFIPGARVVTGQLNSEFHMDADRVTISTGAPTKYRCTGSPNYQCIQDANGPYNSLTECQAACVPPTTKYRCTGSPNYQCIQDANGPYNSLTECQASCKPITKMFTVNTVGSPTRPTGVLVTRSSKGDHTADEACKDACDIIKKIDQKI